MKRLFYLLILLSLCSFHTEDPFKDLLKKLEEFTKLYPTEKVHLHLDKPYYAAGDNIWFKAYVADARTSQPTEHSGVLYVELISEADSICIQHRLPLRGGISWGDFKLADNLVEGNYRIRAYTQLMRNAGPDFFFDKIIKIGSKWTNRTFTNTSFLTKSKGGVEETVALISFSDSLQKAIVNRPVSYVVRYPNKSIKGKIQTDASGTANVPLPLDMNIGTIVATIDLGKGKTTTKTIPVTSQSSKIDVQFLPEGGKMVQGITSKVGIKAIASNGKGIDVSGVILDDLGVETTTFRTTHLGMGSFYLSPQKGRSYRAKLKLANNTEHLVSLPVAEETGYVLTVNNTDTLNTNIKITMSADLLGLGELNLIAHKHGLVYFAAKIPTAKQVARIVLQNEKLPSGIVQLTLLSPQNLPLAERLVFVENVNDRIEVDLSLLKPSYPKRGRVELEFRAKTQGNFSLAVTNEDVVRPDEDNESNILTSMLLTSDLKGYVERPNLYFTLSDSTRRGKLDNLLLTQGWRKIYWKELDAQKLSPANYEAEKGIRISGTIQKDKKPLAKSSVSLMSNTDGLFLVDTMSDSQGYFTFDNLEFPDSTKFLIQARSEQGKKTIDIALDTMSAQLVTANSHYADIEPNVNQQMGAYLEGSVAYFEEQNRQGLLSKSILLKEVKIEGKKTNPAKNSSNLNGAGQADEVFDGDDMLFSPSLESYLNRKMTRMTIKKGKPMLLSSMNGGVRVFVDGNEMPSDFSLYDLKVEDIESVEVLASPGKSVVYRGAAMLITTRRGPAKWPVVKYAPGVITYTPKGYYNAREFYSPMYNLAPNNKPDLRTTVFWAPNLSTDEAGKVKFDYFNTDRPGPYRIVLEGIDVDGKIVRSTYHYKVTD